MLCSFSLPCNFPLYGYLCVFWSVDNWVVSTLFFLLPLSTMLLNFFFCRYFLVPTGNNDSRDVSFKPFCYNVKWILHCIAVTQTPGNLRPTTNYTIRFSPLDLKCILWFSFLFSFFKTNAGLSIRPGDPAFTRKNDLLNKSFSSCNMQRLIPLEKARGGLEHLHF